MYYEMSYANGKNIRKHRLVMQKHLGRDLSPNEIVHHIDGDIRNNDITNLALTTRSRHIKEHGLDGSRCRKKVHQLDLNGTVIKEWESLRAIEAATGYFATNISKCCNGKTKSAYGYDWRVSDAEVE